MEREIKFRGKRAYSGEWVFGNLIQGKNGKKYIIPFDWVEEDGHHLEINSDIPVFTDQKTIGQFTGLHDKNGKEIYEEDILRCLDADGEYYNTEVKWNGGSFMVEVNGCDYDYTVIGWAMNNEIEELEIIGNIYDNPKIL
jgi:uncharacterized phage protein (TIGR01671 family)